MDEINWFSDKKLLARFLPELYTTHYHCHYQAKTNTNSDNVGNSIIFRKNYEVKLSIFRAVELM